MSRNSPHTRNHRPLHLLGLTAIFLAEWIILAVHPVNRIDWLAENILVALAAIGLALSHRHFVFSRLAYTLTFLFLALHEVGAHYTYAGVPYDAWFQRLTGHSLNALLGWRRNNFDRLMHLLYGLLMAYPIRSVYLRVANVRGFWTYFLPLSFVMSTSMIYELLEWAGATWFGGAVSVHFVGMQGDPWDAQKDMALAMLGAFITMGGVAVNNAVRQRDFAHEWAESVRVKRKVPW